MTNSRRYLRILFITVATLLPLVIGLNKVIDPFRLYNGPELSGINEIKPEIDNRARLAKAWGVYRRKPTGIILGSSRSDYGLNPEHSGWTTKNVYNLALPGGSVYEALRYLQHAQVINPLEQAVLGVDFFMFNTYWPKTLDFDENRLLTTQDGKINRHFKRFEKLEILTSVDTLISSFKTIKAQKNEFFVEPPHIANGQRHPTMREAYMPVAGGYHALFVDDIKAHILRRWLPPPHLDYRFDDPNTGESTFDWFRSILKFAHDNHIDLRIIISPSHALLWEALFDMGLGDKWEIWKRELVRINEEEAKKLGASPFQLWDFSGYNRYTTETLPPLGDKESKMQWYWEGSHYKSALGDIVLNQVFDTHVRSEDPSKDFGVLLTKENIEMHLANIRRAQVQYRESHRDAIQEVKDLVQEFALKHYDSPLLSDSLTRSKTNGAGL